MITTSLASARSKIIPNSQPYALTVARLDYALACVVGVIGLVIFAFAPSPLLGAAGVLLVSGIALPLTRTLATIMVNCRTTDKVRATVHSFLAQAEYLVKLFAAQQSVC